MSLPMPPTAPSTAAATTRELWRFALSGLTGLAVDVAVLYLALACGAGYYLGRVISFLCSVFATWQMNRRYTFSRNVAHNDAGNGAVSLWREWWHYLGAMLAGGAVNYGAYSIAVYYLRDYTLGPMLAVAVGSLAGMTLNYASAKWLIFKRRG